MIAAVADATPQSGHVRLWRTMTWAGAALAAVAPIRQGYVYPFVGVAAVVALAGSRTCPRLLRLIAGTLLVLSAIAALMSEPTDGWRAILVSVVLAQTGVGALGLWRATAPMLDDSDPATARRVRRLRWGRVAAFTIGALGVSASAALALSAVRSDGTLGFGGINCGSLLMPRALAQAVPHADPPDIFRAFTEVACDSAREERLGFTGLFGIGGLLLVAATLAPRGRTAFAHPFRLAGAVLVAGVVTAAVAATQAERATTLADQLNRQSASWRTKYEADLIKVTGEIPLAMAQAASKRDYPQLAARCTTERELTDRLRNAPGELPGPLVFLRHDMKAFLTAVRQASDECIAAASAHDQARLKTRVGPLLQRAGTLAERLANGLRPR